MDAYFLERLTSEIEQDFKATRADMLETDETISRLLAALRESRDAITRGDIDFASDEINAALAREARPDGYETDADLLDSLEISALESIQHWVSK